MRITIVVDINHNCRVPEWLMEAIRQAERYGAGATVTVHSSKRKAVASNA